jgi:diguanylate cyclase (GGDEF)-like protein
MKVLIVDDMLPNAMLLQALLDSLPDVETEVVETAAQALEICRAEVPDLLVTDYVMPEMDGVELVRTLRASWPDDFIPVLMVTAEGERKILYEAFEAGVTDFLRKPVDEIELRARVRNMLALRRQHLELERLAAVDPLTGALNRRAFVAQLEAEAGRAARHGGPYAVVMMDIDHFKAVNDTYGHDGGDRALVAFSAAVKSVLRDTDCFGRWGGEEFAILLPQTDAAGAGALAERLRLSVASVRVPTDKGLLEITTSAGIAVYRGDTPDMILRRADKALYAAKANGRNRVEIASPEPA